MKKLIIFIILVLPLFLGSRAYASMSDYCYDPPFLSRVVPPNVMIILDNSGSMLNFAYDYNGGSTSTGFDSTKTYYGYFDSAKKYSYTSSHFYESGAGKWNGNFLNWLTMRRIDIARKVLVGGKYSSGYLMGDEADYSGRGHKKKVDNAGNYTPYSGIRYFYFNDSGPGTSVFTVGGSSYNVKIEVSEPKGVIQNVGNKIRWGLSFYNYSEGGHVGVPVGDNKTQSMVGRINNEYPQTWTPLAETLWTVAGYFAQKASMLGGYGPRYHSGDYEISNSVDPYDNYGTSNNVRCAKSFVIMITDGEPTQDNDLPNGLKNYAASHGGYNYTDSKFLEDVALYVHTVDLRPDLEGKQTLTIYPVFAFGSGSDLLKDTAINGGFVDSDNNIEPNLQSEWDKNGDGVPDNYFEAEDGAQLETALEKAITDILRRASSGTAASVLGSSQKSGANILQAVFYPQKYFNNNTEAEWIGKLQNLWFYLGPFTQNMREDTDGHDNDEIKSFNLKEDNVIEFYSDNSTTMAKVCTDTNGDGRIDGDENATCKSDVPLKDIKPIWEAGKVLWKTPQSKRYIFTDVSGLSDNLTKGNFIPKNANAKALKSYLDADNKSEAKNIIRYIRGKHISGKRDRRVTIGSHTHVWKLGDIIDSTPQMISPTPLNTYWEDYNDNTYKEFTSSDAYKNRGMVFAGANDGMLHAFRFGHLSFPGGNIMAKLTKPDGGFGSEAWAFIPKNILPYLKYYMDSNYCHLYYVDLTPYVFDASINKPGEHKTDYYKQTKTGDDNTWRTILIGGLNFGGACGDDNSTAIHPPNETGNVPQGVGRSSYFALDVTDPENPTVLWEFTDNNTAFTTTGPAIIHIPVKYTSGQNSGKDDNSKNGYWYVVFASGPDNYNGTVHQPLYLYVLDLKTGNVMRKWQLSGNNCTLSGDNTCQISLIGNHNAFAGRLFSSQMDLGENYSDDLLYFGYTYGSNSDWHGGVLRLVTGDNGDVNTWKVSKLIGDIGPVTSSVTHIEDTGNHNLWVYFGGGRYFSTDDDGNAQRTIYGVKDTCYNSGSIDNCTNSDTLSLSELDNATDDNNNIDPSTITHGWYINLDPSSGGYGSERVVTNPVATTNGWVFYTTFAPTSDICGFGGKTSVWMVNYDNGGTPQNVEGTVFLQTSNSVINRIELSKEFGAGKGAHNGRKSKSFNGEGSTGGSGGGTFTVPPPPLNSVIHWTETPIRKGK